MLRCAVLCLQVEQMVRMKMEQKEYIILCLEDSNDWSNATTRRLVMQVSGRGRGAGRGGRGEGRGRGRGRRREARPGEASWSLSASPRRVVPWRRPCRALYA